MMVKSAQPGKDGGCTPTPFHYTVSTITYKVVLYAPAGRADTLHLFLLYPYIYSVGRPDHVFTSQFRHIIKHDMPYLWWVRKTTMTWAETFYFRHCVLFKNCCYSHSERPRQSQNVNFNGWPTTWPQLLFILNLQSPSMFQFVSSFRPWAKSGAQVSHAWLRWFRSCHR